MFGAPKCPMTNPAGEAALLEFCTRGFIFGTHKGHVRNRPNGTHSQRTAIVWKVEDGIRTKRMHQKKNTYLKCSRRGSLGKPRCGRLVGRRGVAAPPTGGSLKRGFSREKKCVEFEARRTVWRR